MRDRRAARWILAWLAADVLRAIRRGQLGIEEAERVIFNLDVLLFCRRHLRDRELSWIVEYGMELSSIERLVGKREKVLDACQVIEDRLAQLTAKLISPPASSPRRALRALARSAHGRQRSCKRTRRATALSRR
ncbi:MAG: DUF3969 family protein [Planctomycetes bacterium]|nr:DUF3969 family protein [Planctomycetota bacterium]